MNLIQRGVAATGDAGGRRHTEAPAQDFLEYYGDNIADHSVVFEGLLDVLDKAEAAGLKLGVCTNKVENLSHKLLTELGMRQRFGSLIGGDTLPVMKPDPAPLREASRGSALTRPRP